MLGMNAAWLRLRKGMLCLLFFMLLPAAHAVSMPAAAVASQKTQPAAEAAPHEPTVEEKKAAYSALATILENEQSRQELIEQLRNAAASPSDTAAPELTRPASKRKRKKPSCKA